MTRPFIFLDDIRQIGDVTWVALPSGSWIIVRSYDEFVSTVKAYGVPSFVSFDHDLGVEHYLPEVDPADYVEKTGRDCAYWLAQRCIDIGTPIPQYVVHSQNPVGAINIRCVMDSARRLQGDL